MKKEIITDEERMGSEAFDKLLKEDYERELKKPRSITVYAPRAQMDMEDIFSPSDDIHHPNYRGN